MLGIELPKALVDRLERLSALADESVQDLVIGAITTRVADLEDTFHEGGLPTERLRQRLYERAARVLHHYWIDQKTAAIRPHELALESSTTFFTTASFFMDRLVIVLLIKSI